MPESSIFFALQVPYHKSTEMFEKLMVGVILVQSTVYIIVMFLVTQNIAPLLDL